MGKTHGIKLRINPAKKDKIMLFTSTTYYLFYKHHKFYS